MSFYSLLARLSDMFGAAGQGIPFANRNFIVDGGTEYVQGSSTALSGTTTSYTCNVMFIGAAGTGGAATVTNAAGRNGWWYPYLDSGSNGVYSHQQTTASTGSVATNDLPYMAQRIEFANKLAGRSITVSGKVWVASGTATIPGVLCNQNFGTGGSPSTAVANGKNVNWNVTTTPKKFSVRIDLPSVVGKTFGTNGNDFTVVGFWMPAGWTGTMYFTEIQVELCNPNASSDLNGNGGAPTAFEYRGWQTEYGRIQRFYDYAPNAAFWSGSCTSGWNYITQATFAVPMRAVPAVVFNSAGSVSNFPTTLTGNGTTSRMVSAYSTSNSTSSSGGFGFGYTADARL